jgi:hypothetical protein
MVFGMEIPCGAPLHFQTINKVFIVIKLEEGPFLGHLVTCVLA